MHFQTISLKSFAFHLLVTFTLLSLVSKVLAKRNDPNAIAYETAAKGKQKAEFADGPSEWANMKQVLKNNQMKKLGLLCVTGTFLLYAQNDYQAGNEQEIRILSGTNSCIPPGLALSIQSASSFDNPKNSSLVLFKDKILRGNGFAISRNMDDFSRKFSGRANSMIINGKDSWTLYSNQGDSYCFKPKDASESSICMLLSGYSTAIEKDNKFYKVEKGCDESAQRNTINLSNCLKFGAGKLEKIGTAKKPAAQNNNTENESEDDTVGSPIQDCNDNDELMKLLDIRIHHDFSDQYQMIFPKNKNLAWRTELLDNSFDITLAVCPDHAVDPEFLQIIRELYIYLVEKVWDTGNGWPKNKTEEVNRMIDGTSHCLDILQSGSISHFQESIMSVLNFNTPAFLPDSYLQEFKIVNNLSTVMEVVWLIYNHVAALCHTAFDYKSNFWPDFSIVFYDMYLNPMKKHWANPDKFQMYMQVLLGGYDINQQLQGLTICVTDIFQSIQTLEILPRPEDLQKSSDNSVETSSEASDKKPSKE